MTAHFTRNTVEKKAIRDHVTAIIRREVGFMNGWHVSEETLTGACRKAAEKLMTYFATSKRLYKKVPQ